jgi:hypothetical protein
MSEHGHIDQVDGDTLDAMRAEMASWCATPEAQNLMAGLSDAEVLDTADASHPGGAAALAAEVTA